MDANNAKAQIDYILINKRWINSTQNSEAYSPFEGVSSDHRIDTTKIRLSLRRNKTETVKIKRYDWFSLTSRNISNEYKIIVRNKFDTLLEISETHNPNKEQENFVHAHKVG